MGSWAPSTGCSLGEVITRSQHDCVWGSACVCHVCLFSFTSEPRARVCLRVYFISVHFAWFDPTALSPLICFGVGDRVCVCVCVCVQV